MIRLFVNVDHVATIREARKTIEPSPLKAALLAEKAGAQGITIHLREDRRHIQDEDVRHGVGTGWQSAFTNMTADLGGDDG